ncbi:MAG: glycine cleavage system protein GcvH [Candidatus Rifleibacteriota bacterium]
MKFTKNHEWVNLEGENATIGISAYAAEQLGDVVYVELPEVGDSIKKGEPIGTIESVKTVSDLYAPVSGEVAELNEEIEDNPGLVNEEAQKGGWLLKVKVSDKNELNDLLNEEDYKKICE